MSKLTYKDIIEDTLKYYTTHNRGLKQPGECVYITENGDMCAVGRWAKNPRELEDNGGGDIYGVIEQLVRENDKVGEEHHYKLVLSHYILKDEVAHLNNTNFWKELQIFHDFDNNWKNKELTDTGKLKYKELLEKWSSVS